MQRGKDDTRECLKNLVANFIILHLFEHFRGIMAFELTDRQNRDYGLIYIGLLRLVNQRWTQLRSLYRFRPQPDPNGQRDQRIRPSNDF
jgi:hypothetical protein